MNKNKKETPQLNWTQKIALKQAIKTIKRKQKKWDAQDQQNRTKLLKTIIDLQDVITIYEDDECTQETTTEDLQKKTTDELIQLLNDIITETEKNI